MDELMSGIVPSIRTFLHRDQVLLDTIPLLLHIVVPNLRTVSITLNIQFCSMCYLYYAIYIYLHKIYI